MYLRAQTLNAETPAGKWLIPVTIDIRCTRSHPYTLVMCKCDWIYTLMTGCFIKHSHLITYRARKHWLDYKFRRWYTCTHLNIPFGIQRNEHRMNVWALRNQTCPRSYQHTERCARLHHLFIHKLPVRNIAPTYSTLMYIECTDNAPRPRRGSQACFSMSSTHARPMS